MQKWHALHHLPTLHICVLSHSTPGVDQSVSTDVITVNTDSEYCMPQTVISTFLQTPHMIKTRKVQIDKLHSVVKKGV